MRREKEFEPKAYSLILPCIFQEAFLRHLKARSLSSGKRKRLARVVSYMPIKRAKPDARTNLIRRAPSNEAKPSRGRFTFKTGSHRYESP